MDLSHYRTFISYRRFSSKGQAKGTSESRQDEAAAAFAGEHQISLSSLSAFDRGLSGYHGDNLSKGALGVLLEALKAGAVPTPCLLLLEEQDRFGRLPSTRALQVLFGGVLELGCDIYHLSKRQLYSADRVNEDLGALITLAAEVHAANRHSVRLSQRLLAAHQKGREKIARLEPCRIGWAPAWIQWDGTAWSLSPYAATVRRLLDLLELGNGTMLTAKLLTSEGHRTPRGLKWTAGSVDAIVRSPVVAGGRSLRRRTGEVAWNYFPPLISRGRWQVLLDEMTRRNGDPSRAGNQQGLCFIGQGISFCASCGRPVGYRSCSYQNADGRQLRQYVRCRGRQEGVCDAKAIPLALIHAVILTRLQPASLSALFPQQQDTALSSLQVRITKAIEAQQDAEAAVTAGHQQITLLLASDADLIPIVARSIRDAEIRAATAASTRADLEHQAAMLRRSQSEDARQELHAHVVDLLQSIAAGTETAVQRIAVNRALRALSLRILIDSASQRVGLAIGDALTQWGPIHAEALAQLADGLTGVSLRTVFGVPVEDTFTAPDGQFSKSDPL